MSKEAKKWYPTPAQKRLIERWGSPGVLLRPTHVLFRFY
jgi:hypothetical protein